MQRITEMFSNPRLGQRCVRLRVSRKRKPMLSHAGVVSQEVVSMKLRKLFLLICPGLVLIPCLAAQVGPAPGGAAQLGPGVVVAKIAQNSEGEKAGMQAGDVLLKWVGADANGAIASPFDLIQAEMEQAPRGSVALQGMRGTEPRTWTIGPNVWGLQARPNFEERLLEIYREGHELLVVGKLNQATERWRAAAESQIGWVHAWLLLDAAEMLKDSRRWKEADDAYRRSIQDGTAVGPAIEGQLLRSWALTYEQRADWRSAEKYNRQCALQGEKAGSDSLLTAWCLYGLGNMFRLSGDFDKAEEYLNRSLEIRRKQAPGSLAVASAVNALGLVAQDRSNLDKAEQYLQEALEIRKRLAANSLEVAASFNNLGSVADDRGDLDKAEEYHLQALAIKEALAPESLDAAFTYSNLGIVSFARGDLPKAEAYMRHSLEIRKRLSPDGSDIAENLGNLGTVRWRCGDFAAAEKYYREALTIQQKFVPASLYVANTLDNLGNLALSQQDLEKAGYYHHQALQIRKKVAPASLDISNSFDNLGDLAAAKGDLREAENYYQQALDLQEKLAPNSPAVAASLSNLGDLAKRHGDLAAAEKYYLRALAIEEKLFPDSLDTAETLRSRGDVARSAHNPALAQEFYRRALAIQQRLAPGSAQYAQSLASLAAILYDTRESDAAAHLFEQALDVLDTQTARLGGSQDVRSEFRARYSAYYKDYIDLLVAQQRAAEAFHVAERWRTRSLLEMLAAARVDIHQGADPELLERERSLQQSLSAKRDRRVSLLTGKHNEEQVQAVEKEIESSRAEYEQVESEIRATSPAYAALTQPQPLTAKGVQELLDDDTMLLEYSLGEDRSYLWSLTSSSLTVHELPDRQIIEATARRLYNLVSGPGRTEERDGPTANLRRTRVAVTASALSHTILSPVAQRIQGKRLLIVADGALQYVPFAFLPEPGKPGGVPLILGHEIVYSPSASVLAELRRGAKGRQPAPRAVAVLADPVFDRQDPRVQASHGVMKPAVTERPFLSVEHWNRSAADVGLAHLSRLAYSRREADAIVALVPAGQGLEAVGFEANRSLATSRALAQYRTVHFATHGLSDNRHPELSGLVLSLVNRAGRLQNGFLDLQDIYNLNLPVELVVMSACKTALGKEIQGEGIIGLTRGFMYAGATRVVASLWDVDDVSTKELMKRFYRAMEQEAQRPAAALRSAQVAMWKQRRWRDPYYWAAFEIQGEWK
jgi:CHAT domain-containing protein/Tfp pilus assembly protein PilF